MSHDIFISYSRRDLALVQPIKEELETAGFSCWMDLQGIESGSEEFTDKIAAAIEGSCITLFFLSDGSQESRWSLNELRVARDEGKHVVLVRFNDDRMKIKFKLEFGGSDIIDWRQPEQKAKLLRNLKEWAAPAMVVVAPSAATTFVKCPVCGKKNRPEDTFKCRECGRDNLCLRHQDEVTFLCFDCAAKAREEAERNRPGAVLPVTVAGVSFNLRRIPAKGTQVAFWMGETPVTQRLWTAVMGRNPSRFRGDDRRPVEQVSWDDCQDFLKKLNALVEAHSTGLSFRLPTEEEWKHSCRAGSTGKYCRLADGTEITVETLGRVAWFEDNSGGTTHPVGGKEPNAWGLHDLLGNVWEWTQTADGQRRVVCGGGWDAPAMFCESSLRFRYSPSLRSNSLGFRLCATDENRNP